MFIAAYYIAATTGRNILVEDHSVFGATCRHIHCGFPYRSEYFPNDYRRSNTSFKFIYENSDLLNKYMAKEMEKKDRVFHTNIVLDGFLDGVSLWPQVDEVYTCALEISGCSDGNHACVNGYAISQLLRGPFKLPLRRHAVSRFLVGLNTSSEMFHMPFQAMTSPGRRSEIDMAIHLRLEFNGFENFDSVNSSSYRSEVEEWLASEQYKTLSTAISAQIISVLSNISTTASIKKAEYSVYLAADNASVKNVLNRHIQLAVSSITQTDSSSLTRMAVRIMMLNMTNILHINHHNTPMSHYNHDTFATMFDWYAITSANSLLTWSKNELRQSTYTQASIAMKYALNYSSPSYCLLYDKQKMPFWKQI